MSLPTEAQKWLDDHEDQLPQMNRGGKVGGSKISYFEELIPERIGGMTVEPVPVVSSAPYQAAESLLIHAVKEAGLSPIEVYVLSRVATGLKHREIAREIWVSRSRVTQILNSSIARIWEVTKKQESSH